MAKYVKEYHEGLTASSVKTMTVYRLTITFSITHEQWPGQIHQHYFEYNEGLLYSYLMEFLDMKHIESIKIDKV